MISMLVTEAANMPVPTIRGGLKVTKAHFATGTVRANQGVGVPVLLEVLAMEGGHIAVSLQPRGSGAVEFKNFHGSRPFPPMDIYNMETADPFALTQLALALNSDTDELGATRRGVVTVVRDYLMSLPPRTAKSLGI